MVGFIYSNAKCRRSGTTMRKMRSRNCDRSFHANREVLPGFPKHFKFESMEQVLEYVSKDTVCCLLCGKHYKQLAPHVKRIHDMWTDDYKKLYGIPRRIGLQGVATTERHRAAFDPYKVAASIDPKNRKKGKALPLASFERDTITAHCTKIASAGGQTQGEKWKEVSPALKTKFLECIAGGMFATDACKEVGIGRTTVKRWAKKDADFARIYAQLPRRKGGWTWESIGRTRKPKP